MKFFVPLIIFLLLCLPIYAQNKITNSDIYDSSVSAVVIIDKVCNDKIKDSGSGTLISKDGLIITAAHVVANADSIIVKTIDGKIFEAELITLDYGYIKDGLALIKINSKEDLPYLDFASSASVGDEVLVIGHPFGYTWTLSCGIISRLSIKDHLLQTDADMNPGSSGGPVLNTKGEIVGISTFIYNPDQGRFSVGINFAILPDKIEKFIEDNHLKNKQ